MAEISREKVARRYVFGFQDCSPRVVFLTSNCTLFGHEASSCVHNKTHEKCRNTARDISSRDIYYINLIPYRTLINRILSRRSYSSSQTIWSENHMISRDETKQGRLRQIQDHSKKILVHSGTSSHGNLSDLVR